MIVATHLVFTVIVTLAVSGIFALFLRRRESRSGFFLFFLLLFLITLAGSLWIQPFGPYHFGVHWLPVVFIALFTGLFLSYTAPRHPLHNRQTETQVQGEQRLKLRQLTYVTIDLLFWLIVLLLISAILIRFIWLM